MSNTNFETLGSRKRTSSHVFVIDNEHVIERLHLSIITLQSAQSC